MEHLLCQAWGKLQIVDSYLIGALISKTTLGIIVLKSLKNVHKYEYTLVSAESSKHVFQLSCRAFTKPDATQGSADIQQMAQIVDSNAFRHVCISYFLQLQTSINEKCKLDRWFQKSWLQIFLNQAQKRYALIQCTTYTMRPIYIYMCTGLTDTFTLPFSLLDAR